MFFLGFLWVYKFLQVFIYPGYIPAEDELCIYLLDVAGKRKSGKPLYCLLSGLYWTVKNIKMAERVSVLYGD